MLYGLILALFTFAATVASAQIAEDFRRTEVMIPVRDGVKLQTVLFTPLAPKGPLPILLLRTPYGVPVTERALHGGWANLAAGGYIFAFQNIRGRFKSEGQFVMQRPLGDRRDPKRIDESTDAWDTVDWLVKNAHGNNGRVGMMGVSYDGGSLPWHCSIRILR